MPGDIIINYANIWTCVIGLWLCQAALHHLMQCLQCLAKWFTVTVRETYIIYLTRHIVDFAMSSLRGSSMDSADYAGQLYTKPGFC